MNPLQMLMSMGNPNQMLQLLSKNNPQLNQMMQVLQNNNPSNALNVLKSQYGNNPAFQQALKIAEGKKPEELQEFVNNMLNNKIQES